MAITISDSINVGQQKALCKKLDNDGLTYADIDEVNLTLPVGQRHIGLTVQIVDPEDVDKRIEYWYQGGLADEDLVLKTYNGDAGYIPLAGTEDGSPVTGDVEFSDGYQLYSISSSSPEVTNSITFDDDTLYINQFNSDTEYRSAISIAPQAIIITNDDPSTVGITSGQDFSANNDGTDRLIYPQTGWVLDRIAEVGGNQTLQETLENGSTGSVETEINLTSTDGFESASVTISPEGQVDIEATTILLLSSDSLTSISGEETVAISSAELISFSAGEVRVRTQETANHTSLDTNNITETRYNSFPDSDGTLAVSASVNGGTKVYADDEGNIDLTIAAGGGLQTTLSVESTATVATDIVMQHINGDAASMLTLIDDFASLSAADNTFSINATTATIDSNLSVGAAINPTDAVQLQQLEDAISDADGDIEYVGDVYNKTTWTNLADFDTPTATVAVVSNKLSFTGGANDYSQTLAHNFFTNRDKSTYKLTFEANEKSATSYGVAVLFGRVPFRVKFDMTNGVDSGKVSVANPTVGATSSTALVWASGDVISMTVDRVADLVTVTLKNETTPTANVVLNYTFSHLTVAMPNTAKIAIAHLGGTLSVTGIEYSSTELNKPTVMFIGDSKQQGYSPTFIEETFSRRFIRYIGNGVIHAGQGDRTIDVLNSMPEILAMAPKEVYLGIGSNDPRTGVPSVTYTANYASIVSQLTSAGIKVWHLLPIYEPSGLNQVPLRDFIVATYSADDIIDLYTPSSTFVGGWYDTIHLNSLLNNAMYKVLVAANKTRPGKSVSYDTEYKSEVIDTTPSTSTTLAYSAAATNSLLTAKASLAGNTFTSNQTVLGNVTATGFLPPSNASGLLGTTSLAWGTAAVVNGVFTRVKPFSGANLSITDNANTIGITVFNSTANVTVGGTTNAGYKLDVLGSFRSTGNTTAYSAKTANYTLTATDDFVDLTANSASFTLPTAVGITGKTYSVKNSGSGTTLTLATTSSQTIDGTTTKTYNTQYSGVTVVSDGANWKIKI